MSESKKEIIISILYSLVVALFTTPFVIVTIVSNNFTRNLVAFGCIAAVVLLPITYVLDRKLLGSQEP